MLTRESLALATPYEAPQGDLEDLIARLFAEALDVDRVGANDDFFDLGGDSMLSETLSLLISERTKTDFQISTLIDHGSPRRIAALLSSSAQSSIASAAKPEQSRPPIFMVPGREGFILPKPAFRQALDPGQELHVFELPGIRGGRCYTRIEKIASVYVSELQKAYPRGPIFLTAFCMGALIALEMAAQLAAKGRTIHQMVLLDPGLPKPDVVDVEREIRKAMKSSGIAKPSRKQIDRQLWLHRLRRLARTVTHGDANFADDELKFRNDVERKGPEWRYAAQGLSTHARAKLRAAFRHYKPRAFHGPVTIFSAPERDPMLRDRSHLWDELLPQRQVHMVFEEHDDIGTAAAAALVQSVFNAAMANSDRFGGKAPAQGSPPSPHTALAAPLAGSPADVQSSRTRPEPGRRTDTLAADSESGI